MGRDFWNRWRDMGGPPDLLENETPVSMLSTNSIESRSKVTLSQISQFSEVTSPSLATDIPWRNYTNEAFCQPSEIHFGDVHSLNNATSLLFDQEVRNPERDLQANMQSQENVKESELVITEGEVFAHLSLLHLCNTHNSAAMENEKQQTGSKPAFRSDVIRHMPDGFCDGDYGFKTEENVRYENLSLRLARKTILLGQKEYAVLPPPDKIVSKYYTLIDDSIYAVGDEKAFVLKQEYKKSSQENSRVRKRVMLRKGCFSMTVVSSDKDEKCHVLLSKGYPCLVRFPEEAYLSIPSSEIFSQTPLVLRRSPRSLQNRDNCCNGVRQFQEPTPSPMKKKIVDSCISQQTTVKKETCDRKLTEQKKKISKIKKEEASNAGRFTPMSIGVHWSERQLRTLKKEKEKYGKVLCGQGRGGSDWIAIAEVISRVGPRRTPRACCDKMYGCNKDFEKNLKNIRSNPKKRAIDCNSSFASGNAKRFKSSSTDNSERVMPSGSVTCDLNNGNMSNSETKQDAGKGKGWNFFKFFGMH